MSNRAIVVSVVIFLLIVFAAWAFSPRSRVDPKVKAILQKQSQMNGPPTPQQFQQMLAEMEQLTEEQRQQVREARRQRMMRQMQREAAAYCALPPDQREAYLDKRIARSRKAAARMGRIRSAERRTGWTRRTRGRRRPGRRATGRRPRLARRRSRRAPRLSRSHRPATGAKNGQHDGQHHAGRTGGDGAV